MVWLVTLGTIYELLFVVKVSFEVVGVVGLVELVELAGVAGVVGVVWGSIVELAF